MIGDTIAALDRRANNIGEWEMIETTAQLNELLTEPSEALIADLGSLPGDLLIVGASGKMGPTLAVLAKRAFAAADPGRRVFAAARFSDPIARAELERNGVEVVAADLHDQSAVSSLPDASNIVFMVGQKFGTTGQESLTWMTNVVLAQRIAERFPSSRIVSFSSGNIYPFLPPGSGGADESVPPQPIGEYAQSCLARERIFEHAAQTHGTPVTIFRLNYAIDLRYGVLLDIASSVYRREPVDLTMGSVNVIWQGDACEVALRALTIADAPPAVVNVTGPETASVRWIARMFGDRFGIEPELIGTEAPASLLSNAAKSFSLFGYPKVSLLTMIDWIADWVRNGGVTINKPTHFQSRNGQF
jgi:nucleoside-diphosphate-sugar epimerase